MRQIKVIFDCNSWISFAMDGRLKKLELFLQNPQFHIYSCQELLTEFDNVSKYPKLQKYLKPDLVQKAQEAIFTFLLSFQNIERPSISRDPDDDYLLYFSEEYGLDFLVTGDKDLLVLKTYGNTKICTFAEFVIEMENLKLI